MSPKMCNVEFIEGMAIVVLAPRLPKSVPVKDILPTPGSQPILMLGKLASCLIQTQTNNNMLHLLGFLGGALFLLC